MSCPLIYRYASFKDSDTIKSRPSSRKTSSIHFPLHVGQHEAIEFVALATIKWYEEDPDFCKAKGSMIYQLRQR